MVEDGVLGVAGNEEHLQVRPMLARRVRHLAAVQPAREADVGDQQVDANVRLQHLEAGSAVAGLDGGIARSSSTSVTNMRTVGSSSTTSTVSPALARAASESR